jgi:hypothetical protein
MTICAAIFKHTDISVLQTKNKMADIPLMYAVKQPLGTNNSTSHVDICQSNCVYDLIGDSCKFQILICERQS